jgi:hypothetical protein
MKKFPLYIKADFPSIEEWPDLPGYRNTRILPEPYETIISGEDPKPEGPSSPEEKLTMVERQLGQLQSSMIELQGKTEGTNLADDVNRMMILLTAARYFLRND